MPVIQAPIKAVEELLNIQAVGALAESRECNLSYIRDAISICVFAKQNIRRRTNEDPQRSKSQQLARGDRPRRRTTYRTARRHQCPRAAECVRDARLSARNNPCISTTKSLPYSSNAMAMGSFTNGSAATKSMRKHGLMRKVDRALSGSVRGIRGRSFGSTTAQQLYYRG